MKKLIADICGKPDGGFRQRFYCQGDSGQLDLAVSHTLLMLVAEMLPPSDAALEELVEQAARVHYVPHDRSLPDWSVNDKSVWLAAPMARLGHIAISNENIDEYSAGEGGCPMQFTYEQFRVALKHWRYFQGLVARESREALVGRRYEVDFTE